jgi:predicted metal-dependent hydrolase
MYAIAVAMMLVDGDCFEVRAPDGRAAQVRLRVNPRARRISLRIDATARQAIAIVSSTRRVKEAAAFAASRAEWICARLEALPRAFPLRVGRSIPLRGHLTQLAHLPRGHARLEEGVPPILYAGGQDEAFGARVKAFLKRAAREDAAAYCARHAQTLGLGLPPLSIKDTRSRWGSCTSDGRLALSWRLICAPPYVFDYVCAHEIAHLRELNHSARFWALVDQCGVDTRAAEGWLKRHGAGLHAIGASA